MSTKAESIQHHKQELSEGPILKKIAIHGYLRIIEINNEMIIPNQIKNIIILYLKTYVYNLW